jgi:hypothetical protein
MKNKLIRAAGMQEGTTGLQLDNGKVIPTSHCGHCGKQGWWLKDDAGKSVMMTSFDLSTRKFTIDRCRG